MRLTRLVASLALASAVGCGAAELGASGGSDEGALAVDPAAVTTTAGQSVQFAAVSAPAPPLVDWSITEGAAGGTIDASGRYTAPGARGVFHVVATARADPRRKGQATVTVTVPTGTPNLVVDASRTFQTMDGMGASASVQLWNGGALRPALDALAVDNGMSLFRVVRDRMDWVPSAADVPLLHARDAATLTRIYEAPAMAAIWGTIGHLNSRGVRGRQLCLNFMGWTPTWLGGSGRYGVASKVTSGFEDELATMIASLVYYGRRVKNLDFTCLSPLNEPDLNGLEGPLVNAAQYARIAAALVAELDAMGLGDVRLVAPDTLQGAESYAAALQGDAATWARVDHLSFHNYAGATSPGTSYAGKTWWLTETAQWDDTLDRGGTPGMGEWAFGAATFDIVLRDVLNGFPAVLVWEGYDTWYDHHDAYSRWGLLSYDERAGTYAKRKRFHVNGHLTRWIRPGQQRISVTAPGNVLAAAFADRTAATLSIVGHNGGGSAVVLEGSLRSLPFTVTSLRFYETDAGAKNQARGADVAVAGDRFSVTVGADTVFALSNVP